MVEELWKKDKLSLSLTKCSINDYLRWLVPVFHARAHVRLPNREDPLARISKQIWRQSALFTKGYLALFEKKFVFAETVSPRTFLVISIYGRKMLPQLNARVLETSSRLCCDRSCRDRDRAIQACSRSLKVISKVVKEQNTISVYLFLFS